MKITGVKGYALDFPQNPPWGYSKGWVDSAPLGLIEVQTDQGLIGWGEAYGPPGPVLRMIDDFCDDVVVGFDLYRTEALWATLRHHARDHSQSGVALAAISALDIACWDIKGKALGVPVCTLLGGAVREKLDCYASAIRYTREDNDDTVADPLPLVERFFEAGYGAVKMAIGLLDLASDVERVRRVRAHLPDNVGLILDANHAYTVRAAKRLVGLIGDLDILWLEDPLPQEDIPGYQLLRKATAMPLASGETLATRSGFREALLAGVFDVMLPEVGLAGGLTEAAKVWDVAATFGVECTPHGYAGAVGTAAAVHLAASRCAQPWPGAPAPLPFEWTPAPGDRFGDIATDPLRCTNGEVEVPLDRPGLGIDINRDARQKCLRVE